MTPIALLFACANPPHQHDAPSPKGSDTPEGSNTPEGSTPEDSDTPEDSGTPPSGPENVLLVVLDDINTDYIGLYSPPDPAPPTPAIDGLAAKGMWFDEAWSMPMCAPARAALITGRYPSRTHVGMVPENDGPNLPDAELTIPELLAAAAPSWDTSQVGKWHLSGYDAPAALTGPGDHGFAWYAGSPGNLEPNIVGPHGYYNWDKNDNGTLSPTTTYATTDTADDTIARIGAMTEPWFLLAAFHAPHGPYEDPPPELVEGPVGGEWIDKYRASITAVDAELGRVLESIPADVRARTTIVVMGDNGTDDALPPDQYGKVKATGYEGGVRVPLIVAGPRVSVPGSSTTALVSVVDWLPTIAEIAGVAASPTAGPVDGVSLLPVLADPTATVRDTLYAELFFPPPDDDSMTYTIRDARYKLIIARNWPYLDDTSDRSELFDLIADPDETTDLATDPAYADVLARLDDEADLLRADMGAAVIPFP